MLNADFFGRNSNQLWVRFWWLTSCCKSFMILVFFSISTLRNLIWRQKEKLVMIILNAQHQYLFIYDSANRINGGYGCRVFSFKQYMWNDVHWMKNIINWPPILKEQGSILYFLVTVSKSRENTKNQQSLSLSSPACVWHSPNICYYRRHESLRLWIFANITQTGVKSV